MSEYIDELRAMWDDALAEAVRNRANKNAAENGDGAKYSLRSYSEQQLRNWENSKRIVVYSSEAQLREFIKDARAGRIGGRKMYFGMVPQNLAQKIMSETGINVDGYNCSLSAYEIQKIFKDHGNAATERLRGQRAVTEDDVAAIPEILQDADTIVPSDKKYNGKPAIQFTKNGNGRVNLVAVVSDKHLDLFVQTMYAGIKKGNLATPTGEQAPINTPEARRSTVSNNSIRSSSENSNTKIKKSERDSEGRTLSKEQQFYFADSKVRDRAGNLRVIYRGGLGILLYLTGESPRVQTCMGAASTLRTARRMLRSMARRGSFILMSKRRFQRRRQRLQKPNSASFLMRLPQTLMTTASKTMDMGRQLRACFDLYTANQILLCYMILTRRPSAIWQRRCGCSTT